MANKSTDIRLWTVPAITLVIGGIAVGVALYRESDTDVSESASGQLATAEYGERLLRETTLYLGEGQPDPAMRYIGNGLDCASCHLDTGRQPGTLSLMQSASRYPRFSGRDGGERDLRDRINGCMQRSMNGLPLPRDSVEMIAMESYILQLGRDFGAMPASKVMAVEPAAFNEPDRRADIEAGRLVYEAKCQVCHGVNGEGLHASGDHGEGFVFPPLWGPESYNDGAGMGRVLTAASFIKARMPLGAPDLSDDEAFDVSAFINAQPRPAMAGLDADYPELFRKPVDSPYPPYADPFPREQHQFGPFGPIRAFYAEVAEE